MSNSTTIDGVDYGPLAQLVGNWSGDKGTDVAPEPDGQEATPYFETLMFEAIGDVTNAEKQTLAVLRYHQVVSRKATGDVFHNETGYWGWDSADNTIWHSLTIPRGVCVLAGGTAAAGDTEINVKATDGGEWGIVQAPFMAQNARTTAFTHKIKVDGDTLSYAETTELDIYGREFDHTDENTLQRA